MKKILLLIVSLTVIFTFVFSAQAAVNYVFDEDNLLSDSEEQALQRRLSEISEIRNCDVAVATVETLDGWDSERVADDFYEDAGFSENGILLLICMEYRDWAYSINGFAETAFTDDGVDHLTENVKPYLSDEDFVSAFNKFADLCDKFLAKAREGTPYDGKNMPINTTDILIRVGISVAIGALISLIVLFVMKAPLKSVRRQPKADSYVRAGSMVITNSSDMFLYHTVSRTPRASSNSGGSGGGSSGGGGSRSGKF